MQSFLKYKTENLCIVQIQVQNQQVDDNHGLDENKNAQKQSTNNCQSKVTLASIIF